MIISYIDYSIQLVIIENILIENISTRNIF